MKITGIYKITSPNNKIYIGQSIDCLGRKSFYKRLACKKQTRLFNSIRKHGWIKHKFEILCQCDRTELNNLEIYYIALFQCFNSKYGLNLRLGGEGGGGHADITKRKIGIMQLGKKHKKETIEKMKLSHKGINNWTLGSTHKPETIKKMSDSHKLIDKSWMKKEGWGKSTCKRVVNIDTNKIYDSITEAAKDNNIKLTTLYSMLRNINRNKTNLRFYEN